MGDFTREAIYRCPATDAAFFHDMPDLDAQRDALTTIHHNARKRVEFRGYSYDHDAFLDDLARLYIPEYDLRLTEYVERPLIMYRVVDPKDVAQHTNAILDLIARCHNHPAPLINIIRNRIAQVVAFFDAAATKPGQDPFFARKHQEGLDNSKRALAKFSLSADDIRQIYDLATIGGFYPGDGPPALDRLDQKHAPHSSILTSLCRSFGFLKTMVLIYEEAADAGDAIVHLQTYGT